MKYIICFLTIIKLQHIQALLRTIIILLYYLALFRTSIFFSQYDENL